MQRALLAGIAAGGGHGRRFFHGRVGKPRKVRPPRGGGGVRQVSEAEEIERFNDTRRRRCLG
ncbi:MAG: hypothetical protein NZ585_14870, partial [Chloracidobacterium sp.]|nr:hypothetical protein [Chloracidobacterium sp.]